MLTKILLTATVILLAWLVVRKRWRTGDGDGDRARIAAPAQASQAAALMPSGAVKLAAYGLVLLMLAGTGFYLFQGWTASREVVQLEVVNVYNGQVERYQALRGQIEQRSFVTLDGRRIQIAEMERLIQVER
jgi:hypothetical protein